MKFIRRSAAATASIIIVVVAAAGIDISGSKWKWREE